LVVQENPASGRAPLDDGWEPERLRRGPTAWFRDHPARFFGVLGTILFVGGWGVAVYLTLSNDQFVNQPVAFRLQLLVSVGSSVTLASGVLWGIAVYIWLHLLPDAPADIPADQDVAPTSPTG
jgi:hypothetical protein